MKIALIWAGIGAASIGIGYGLGLGHLHNTWKCTDWHLFGEEGKRTEQCIEYKRDYE